MLAQTGAKAAPTPPSAGLCREPGRTAWEPDPLHSVTVECNPLLAPQFYGPKAGRGSPAFLTGRTWAITR
jgi:hypothetical protein